MKDHIIQLFLKYLTLYILLEQLLSEAIVIRNSLCFVYARQQIHTYLGGKVCYSHNQLTTKKLFAKYVVVLYKANLLNHRKSQAQVVCRFANHLKKQLH